MNALHSLLKRQLRRFADETIPFVGAHTEFLRAINDAYWQFDEDRKMLEHSLELTSQELLEKNAQLRHINSELEIRVAARTAELSRSEARFRGLFEHAPLSIWEEDFSAVRRNIDELRTSGVVDLTAHFDAHPEFIAENVARVKIVDVNSATLEMFQAESKAELLAGLSKVLGPESLIPFKEELLALARGETSFENETVNYTLRGERRVVLVRLTIAPGYEETWAKVFVGISDITEQRQAEEAIRQSEERFKLMAWATKDAVWDWDLETNEIWWGEGLQKIFHYSSETAQPNPEWRLEHIHPEDREKVNRTINQAMQGGMEFWSKEYRFQRKDRTYADIMDRGYILRDKSGKAYRMIGAMLDITERKYMESSLLEANEQMRLVLNELQRRNSETALLNEMGRLLQACQSTAEAYRIIADLAGQMFPRTGGALYFIDTQRTLVSVVASWGELPATKRMFSPDECWALRRGRTKPLTEVQAGPRCNHLTEPLPTASFCLPLQVQGEILGILHLQSAQDENLDETKRQLAYIVVEQIGMTLSNLRLREALREQSIRDPLTGLYNRRYMEEVLRQQMSRVTRRLLPLGIVMIDIDHFKSFNDTYGHAAGDVLLRELGQFLQKRIRNEDIACRYGGEEFMLIMPDASLETARQRAEDLRHEIRMLRVEGAQSEEPITLSVGVAIHPQHGRTIENILRAADSALYRAKKEGRDRVMVADSAN